MKKNKSNFKIGREKILPHLFILPSIIVFAVFMFWPLIRTIYLSFFSWNMVKPTKTFVGLENYISIFTDSLTYKVFGNTLMYIIILLVLNFVAPYILSFILSAVIKKGKGFYKSVIFLPSVISLVFGLTLPIWSKTEGLVIVVLSLITSWKIFGYNFIVVLAGVSGVSSEVIEAAKMDNVPMYKIFFDIVVPMSSATGIYVFIMTIVQGLQYVFTPIKVITQGGPDNASSNAIYNAYQEAFVLYRTGTASAFAIITMIFFIGLLILEFKYVEKGVYYEN